MICIKSVVASSTISMDERVKQAVHETAHYIEGCRHPVHTLRLTKSQQQQWVPVTDHLCSMDRAHETSLVSDPHPHAWTLFVPQENTVIDFIKPSVTNTDNLMRVYPFDGLLISADEEHLYQCYVHADNDTKPTSLFMKKYN